MPEASLLIIPGEVQKALQDVGAPDPTLDHAP